MIKSLSLTNFRKHSELDLKFEEEGQLILIAGKNGVGKTSILEAITFALYGEGRLGRKNLDKIVKRGAELEGMSVEMGFTLGPDLYRVHRRRDGKNSTSVLYVNDSPLVEGALGVTAEITSLLGMDSQGFKLAVVAQQKDLDGLSSLRPAERAQMITRLLRLDILTKAKEEASAIFRKEREIFKELQTLSSLDPSLEDLKQLKLEEETVALELNNSAGNLLQLKENFDKLEPTNNKWIQANVSHQIASNNFDKVQGDLKTTQDQLASILIPDLLPEINSDIKQLSEKIIMIENQIAQAEVYNKNIEQARILTNDITSLEKKVLGKKKDLKLITPCPGDLELKLTKLSLELKELDLSLLAAQKDLTLVAQSKSELTAKLINNQKDEGNCDHCGQIISAEHRESQNIELLAEEVYINLKLEETTSFLAKLEAAHEELSAEEFILVERINLCKLDLLKRKNYIEQVAELELRVRALNDQLKKVPTSTPIGTLEELYEEKTNLATLASKLQRNIDYNQKREQMVSNKLRLQVDEIFLQGKILQAEKELAENTPTQELINEYQALKLTSEKIEQETLIHTHWTGVMAKTQEQIAQFQSSQARSLIREQSRNQHQLNALNNANAATLLLDVSEKLSQEIRPLLEASVSNLLATMSNGRFSSIKLSEEYEITVLDDEKYHELAELSGGEIDLVALALRLALAEVVSSRHGSGGAGFLILDECFASQDQERRSTILSALRNLKASYHQIFLVSHVENMEDYVDQVININLSADRTETEILCS
jgi:exonuclease SbcC